ncbi:hypothetical protein [Massilia sp. S19_KUP03_FR1]|uniref:hypothetical protein n=1 Tax=Massilia sp. S19_KUP03_FR1 TaxID=3025503 RepID=UPI002FCCB99B
MCAIKNALVLAAFCLPAWACAGGGWQDMPDTLALDAMGDSLRMNGTPMTIRAFQSTQSAEALLREVQANWERNPRHEPVLRSQMQIWTVLNQTVGAQHRSFQVRTSGTQVDGFVALTSPADTRTPVLGLRLPAQVESLQVIDSSDQGRVSQQIVAVSRRSVEATALAFDQALKAENWQRDAPKKHGSAMRLSANRGSEQFDAILSGQQSGALVMISIVK